jgi:hypothetical protein
MTQEVGVLQRWWRALLFEAVLLALAAAALSALSPATMESRTEPRASAREKRTRSFSAEEQAGDLARRAAARHRVERQDKPSR